MKKLNLILLLLLIISTAYSQKISDSKTEYKKDCSNCKFILSEAGKAYSINYREAIKENTEINLFIKELVDFNEISTLKLRAEKAFKAENMNEYYRYFEKIKTLSSKYISDFTVKTKGDAYIYINLVHINNNALKYDIYVDSGVKYGNIRIYYNLQTNKLAYIKADDISYKSFMNNKNATAKNITIWLFEDFETLAYTMNSETKADKDFTSICNDFIEYKTNKISNSFIFTNAITSTTIDISLSFKNCNQK